MAQQGHEERDHPLICGWYFVETDWLLTAVTCDRGHGISFRRPLCDIDHDLNHAGYTSCQSTMNAETGGQYECEYQVLGHRHIVLA